MRTYFPAEPARRALRRLATDRDLTVCALAENLGVDRSTIQRLFTRDRIRWDAGDRIAVALGYHPCQLWPEWFDDIEEVTEWAPTCPTSSPSMRRLVS